MNHLLRNAALGILTASLCSMISPASFAQTARRPGMPPASSEDNAGKQQQQPAKRQPTNAKQPANSRQPANTRQPGRTSNSRQPGKPATKPAAKPAGAAAMPAVSRKTTPKEIAKDFYAQMGKKSPVAYMYLSPKSEKAEQLKKSAQVLASCEQKNLKNALKNYMEMRGGSKKFSDGDIDAKVKAIEEAKQEKQMFDLMKDSVTNGAFARYENVESEFEDEQIDGSKASVKVTRKRSNGNTSTETMKFEQINGLWYLTD